MPKIIGVIGPIGYGKYSRALEIVSEHPKYEISSIADEWKEFKSLCLKSHQKHPGHTLVVTNGGSLFFHGEKKHIRINITEIHAPKVLIAFVSKFKAVELNGISHEDFINTDYWQNAYGLMTDETTPCGKRLRMILNDFNNTIKETCAQRINDGTFKLRSSSSVESSVYPELRSSRHPNHTNYVFDSLDQSVLELSSYCERSVKYQLCLVLWALNSPQVILHGY